MLSYRFRGWCRIPGCMSVTWNSRSSDGPKTSNQGSASALGAVVGTMRSASTSRVGPRILVRYWPVAAGAISSSAVSPLRVRGYPMMGSGWIHEARPVIYTAD